MSYDIPHFMCLKSCVAVVASPCLDPQTLPVKNNILQLSRDVVNNANTRKLREQIDRVHLQPGCMFTVMCVQ